MAHKTLSHKSGSIFRLIAMSAILALTPLSLLAAQPFGVNGDWDYVDIMKTVGWGSPTGDPNFNFDVNGWPTGDATAGVVDVRHNMAWDGPDPSGVNPVVDGTYHLSFTGQATITCNTEGAVGCLINNQSYHTATNTTAADVVLQPGYFLLLLTFTNTQRLPTDAPGNGFTNMRLIPPGYSANTDQVFTSATLKAYGAPLSAVRVPDGMNDYCYDQGDSLGNCFLDAQGDIAPARWEDRVLVTDAFQGGLPAKNTNNHTSHGQAWEYILMFANQTHHDIWINIPVNADDDYVRHLAALLKNGDEFTPGLNPGLHVYVEYANEVWNPGNSNNYTINSVFAQQEGFDPNDPNFYTLGLPERYVLRTIQIAKIFGNIWGQESLNHQIRPVVLWQYTTETNFQRVLEYVENRIKAPVKNYLYGTGQAAYYNYYYNINVPLPSSPGNTYPVEYPTPSSVENTFNSLWTGSDITRRDFIGWKAVASYFGLKEVAYEGGPQVNDGVGAAAARDPRMVPSEVHHFLDNWYAVGGDLVNYTNMRGGIGAGLSGSWFLVEYFNNTNTPRMKGALALMAAPQPAPTAGHVLPWSAAPVVNIDPSQRVPDPFSSEDTPGNGLNQSQGDEALYLLRATGEGTFSISLFGHTDQSTAQTELKVDDRLLTTVSLPVGTDGWSNPVSLTLSAGFHTLLLAGQGESQSHLPSGTGAIQITRISGLGSQVPPSAPSNVVATPSSGQIALLWAPQTTATMYNVKRSTRSGGPYVTVSTTPANTFTDEVPNGKNYYYVVTALNSGGESAFSEQTPAMATPVEAPSAPTGLTGIPAAGDGAFSGGGEVQLSWNPVPNAVAYNIYTSTNSGGYSQGSPTYTVIANSFLDRGEVFTQFGGPNPPGTPFYYVVTALNSFGESPFSAEISATPIELPPPAPTGVSAIAGTGQVTLRWTPVFGLTPSFGPPQYNVKRGTTSGGPYTTVSSLSSPNFIDITVTAGTTYYYVVSAVKSVGESPNSAEVSVTAK